MKTGAPGKKETWGAMYFVYNLRVAGRMATSGCGYRIEEPTG